MVEDKNNTPEDNSEDPLDQSAIDDFLAEDGSEAGNSGEGSVSSDDSGEGGDLDQDSIDALFSGGGEEEEEETASPEGEAEEKEFDQDSIDALFEEGGGEEEETRAAGSADEEEVDAEGEEEPGPEETTVDDLDQDSIDALFSGGGEEEEDTASPEGEAEEKEFDQDSIDALFEEGGGEEEETRAAGSAGEEEVDAEGEEEPGPEETTVDDLDQDSIDALFSGGGEEEEDTASPEGEPEEEELDQDSIDALFAESSSVEEEGLDIPEEPEEEGGEGEVDQSAIDALFTEGTDEEEGESPAAAGEEADLSAEEPGEEGFDQEGIDALFGEETGEEAEAGKTSAPGIAGEEVSGEEVAPGDEGEPPAGDDYEDDLDELFASLEEDEEEKAFLGEDFTFAEEIDSDSGEGEVVKLEEDEGEKKAAGKEAAAAVTGPDAGKKTEERKEGTRLNFAAVLPYLQDRKIMAGLGGFLAVIIAVSAYLLLGNGDEVQERRVAKTESTNVTAKEERKSRKEKVANVKPVASSVDYTMTEGGGNVQITLKATDRDGDELDFVITEKPGYGRLSGTPPNLTYLPSADFSGKDSFRFKVGDGRDFSEEATVMIVGPDLTRRADSGRQEEDAAREDKASAVEEERARIKQLTGVQPAVRAPGVTMTTRSTDSLVLDLAALYEKGNAGSYDRTVYSSLDTSGLRGILEKEGGAVYRYKPDPFFSGIEIIDYRFKKNGVSSPEGRITVKVTLGDPPPVVHLKEMKQREYAVGETVVIDAGPSRDDRRSSLKFTWKQVSGIPVRIRKENREGSRVSFLMPSDFSSRRNPGPLLEVTVTDVSGQQDTALIKTRSVSLRNSALWRKDEIRGNENR